MDSRETRQPKTEAEAGADVEAELNTEVVAEAEAGVDVEAEAGAEAVAESGSEAGSGVDVEAEAKAGAEAESTATAEPEAAPEAEVETGAGAQASEKGVTRSPLGACLGFLRIIGKLVLSFPPLASVRRRRFEKRAIGEAYHNPVIIADDIGLFGVYGYTYRHVDIAIPVGKVTAIVGREGSGKTALLLGLAGHLAPNRGGLTVCGYSDAKDRKEIRRCTGLGLFEGICDAPEHVKVRLVVAAELGLYGKRANREHTLDFMRNYGCEDMAEKRVGALSRLESNRLGILLALASDPKILIIDDIDYKMSVADSIKLMRQLRRYADRGMTVIAGCIAYEVARPADAVVHLTEESELLWQDDTGMPLSRLLPNAKDSGGLGGQVLSRPVKVGELDPDAEQDVVRGVQPRGGAEANAHLARMVDNALSVTNAHSGKLADARVERPSAECPPNGDVCAMGAAAFATTNEFFTPSASTSPPTSTSPLTPAQTSGGAEVGTPDEGFDGTGPIVALEQQMIQERVRRHRPFRAIRLALMSTRDVLGTVPMILTVATIALIPVIYAGLYLLAFQDPYGNIDKIPVAIVNLDAGGSVQGEEMNVGDQIVDSLKDSDGLGWEFVTADDAATGVEVGKYYFSITIPADFTSCIASASSDVPTKARLEVVYNEALNLTATKIGESAVSMVHAQITKTLSEQYFEAVFDKIIAAAAQLQTAVDGSGELSSGLTQLHDGSATLTGYLQEVSSQASAALGNLENLAGNINDLAAQAGPARQGIENAMASILQFYGFSVPDPNNVDLSQYDLAGAGVPQNVIDALWKMSDVCGLLAAVNPQTVSELTGVALSYGSTLVNDAAQLSNGSATITEGLGTAQGGAQQLHEGLADGVEQMSITEAAKKAMSEMMSDPVEVETTYLTKVSNYGEGLAAYFISLGLWVGALIMSFIFRPFNGRALRSGAAPHIAVFSGALPMCALAAVQAVVLAFVIQVPMGIHVVHPLAYYLMTVLTACVFALIIQLLIGAFKLPGKLMAIILLMLQLTSAGGTFPLETSPAIFQIIGPFLPMYYSVMGLRQCISGDSYLLIMGCVVALLAFALVFFLLNCFVAHLKRNMKVTDIHPVFTLDN